MWTKEEVNEIIIAEVSCKAKSCFNSYLIFKILNFKQSMIFLLAGFETTASTLSHTFFQLAKNPKIQEKIYDEIQNKLEHHVNSQ